MISQEDRFYADWNYPTAIRFGVGRVMELPSACKAAGISRPLLVTDPLLAVMPIAKQVLAVNQKAGLPTKVFSGIKAHPIGRNVAEGVEAYKAGRHDGIIAFGGGSALDAAKMIAMMAGQTLPLWDLEDVGDGHTRIETEKMAPVVAIPTTAGTGSEVGMEAMITDERIYKKKIFFHPRMLPAQVIYDPELTLRLPPRLTAATGMDALARSLEAFSSPVFHPMADGIAVESIRLVHNSLVTVYDDPWNIEARAEMLAASSMAATASQKGLGAMRAIAHAVGAFLEAQHGLANAVAMPYVLLFNRPTIEEKMARLGAFLYLPDASFDGVLEWILELRKKLHIPHTLGHLGVAEAELSALTELALADPSSRTNPVHLTKKNLRQLIEDATEGRLE